MVLGESRISQYAREQRSRAVNDDAIGVLESEVSEAERLNLRLRKELLDETTLRVRSERELRELHNQIEDLTAELEERGQFDERAGRPQRIRKNVADDGKGKEVPPIPQRVDGSPTSERRRDVQPVDKPGGVKLPQSGDDGPSSKKSSRVRGTVK